MKQVIGTFFTDTTEDFNTLVDLFEENGYEVARQTGANQAVIITDAPDEVEDVEE